MKQDRYLVEWKPTHEVVSVTVYAELDKSQAQTQQRGVSSLVAFGDPQYSKFCEAPLEPLPATRQEVEAIAGLYQDAVAVYLGEDATEEQAKKISMNTRIVHVACHAIMDERFPLNSALVFTAPKNLWKGWIMDYYRPGRFSKKSESTPIL